MLPLKPGPITLAMWSLVLAVYSPQSARATYSLEEMITASDVIFSGRVTEIVSWSEGGPLPITSVNLVVDSMILDSRNGSRSSSDSIRFEMAGGIGADGVMIAVSGMPTFVVDEEYLVFLRDDGKRYITPTVGGGRGVFRVDGARNMIRDERGGFFAVRTDTIGMHRITPTAADSDAPSDLNAFAALIERLGSASADLPVRSPATDQGWHVLRGPNGELLREPINATAASRSARFESNEVLPSAAQQMPSTLCVDGRHSLPYYIEVYGDDAWEVAAYQIALADWNLHMDIFTPVIADGPFGINGVNEICGFVTNAELLRWLHFNWGDGYALTYTLMDPAYSDVIAETDVMFNANLAWTMDVSVALEDPEIVHLPTAAMHELGHAWGAMINGCTEDYQFDHLSVMHGYYGSPIVENGRGIHGADALAIRANYDDQIPVPDVVDVGVESYHANGYLYPGDLDQIFYMPGENITIAGFTVENVGTSVAANVRLRYYLSTDTVIDESDIQIGSYLSWSSLASGAYEVPSFSTNMPSLIPGGGWHYVGAIVTRDGSLGDDFGENDTSFLNSQLYVNCNPVTVPTLVGPVDGQFCTPTDVLLDWNGITDASGYQIQIGNACGSGSVVDVVSSSYFAGNLAAGDSYFWRVRAISHCGSPGSWSDCFGFVTSPGVLAAPQLLFPSQWSYCEPTTGMLSWDGVSGATGYRLELGPYCGTESYYEVPAREYQYTGLAANEYHQWRVQARSECGEWGSWSACRTFGTMPDTLVSARLLNPIGGARWEGLSGTLSWWSPGAWAADVQLGTSCGEGPVYEAASVNHYQYSGLSPNTMYYWRVRVRNACGEWGAYSTCDSFATMLPTWTDVTPASFGDTDDIYGAVWADHDRDGDLDLFLAASGPNRMLRNDGTAGFVDISQPPLDDARFARDVTAADADNDGRLDLCVANAEGNQLLGGLGEGAFHDITSSPLDEPMDTWGITWIDYDLDGAVDLYATNHGDNRLYRNQGDGTFVDAASGPLVSPGYGNSAAWADYDNDGDPDVFVGCYYDESVLLRNDGSGVFTPVTTGGIDFTGGISGAAWGDYDNDEDLDIYVVVGFGRNRLYRNDGSTFTDVTEPILELDGLASMCASWIDYDNDGLLDLYVSNNSGDNALFRNTEAGFVNEASPPVAGPVYNCSTGASWGDYDGDGDLDLFQADAALMGRLLRNDDPGAHHWLHVRLEGVISNRAAIGARVRAVTGTTSHIREVSGDSGFMSQGSLEVEFGLGGATMVDSLVIRWPQAAHPDLRTQILTDVPVDTVLTIVEPDIEDTAVGEERSDDWPTEIALTSIRPNPFNPVVEIQFGLPEASSVTLEVYDVRGRRVACIASGDYPGGNHSASWYGRDDANRPASSGVYVARLVVNGVSLVKRMLLVR